MGDEATEREELLRRAYAAFNARDIDAVLATMWPDVEWPNGMEGGYVYGHEQVRAYWTRQWGVVNPRVEPLGFTHGGGEVVVEVRHVGRDGSGAVVVEAVVQHVYRFVAGLVKRMEIRSLGGEPGAAPDTDRR